MFPPLVVAMPAPVGRDPIEANLRSIGPKARQFASVLVLLGAVELVLDAIKNLNISIAVFYADSEVQAFSQETDHVLQVRMATSSVRRKHQAHILLVAPM